MSYEEQIMSKDKYISEHIFTQMEAIVLISLQIFFAMHTVFKIRELFSHVSFFSWGIFGHLTSLDQLRTSENI